MKTYKHLWEQFISKENFDLAARKAIKSKKSKKEVQIFLAHSKEYLDKLRNDLIIGKYKTSQYKTFTIYEPKERLIYKLPLYPDHIVHHALINILGPIWQKSFIHDSYACIPGRGLHAASQKMMHFMRRNEYVLQCDIRKFYPSINHEIIMNILKRKIHDNRILKILNEIIWSVGGQTNLPIGNLTSQWLGNVYLNELDNFIKQDLHCRDYIRYCDDFCVFDNDKHKLHFWAKCICVFLKQNMKMNLSRCNIHKTTDGVCFIGYRHFKHFILIKQSTAYKLSKRITNIIENKHFNPKSIGQMAAAYGWTKWCCSYNFRNKIKIFK
ncbi:MAG: hypothetical protein IJL05_00355 [Alphaproteobacteria bacterium]|nr:hypothetical protein [Alphaproteobacteria bacterium]